MGEVWAAARESDLGFQKLVALKVLLSKEKDGNATIMFFDEAKAASALQHQAIVPTVDLGQDGDTLYLAMEMVRGPSLTALLQRLVINKRAMTPAMVAHIGINVASALDYGHARATLEGRKLQLIHRDVSPHNVLLDLNGAVRLTDFGVARTAIQDHKSRVGTVRGKPSYMAPEQVVGGDIDGRTDLFALGIVLYESACLKRLFGRSNPVKSMDAVLKHDPKPLTDFEPDFPVALWKVIEKALQKEPSGRFQTAAEMADALTEALRKLDRPSSAPVDLVALIGKNFESDAFDIESKVALAMAEAGISANEPAPDPTVARSVVVSPVDLGTSVIWPTAYAPDPLAPEAIEEARTQFRALTPSASVAMAMHTPSVDMTPMSGSFVVAPPPPQKSIAIPAAALAAAALVALTAVVVVTRPSPQSPQPDIPVEQPTPSAQQSISVVAKAKEKERPIPAVEIADVADEPVRTVRRPSSAKAKTDDPATPPPKSDEPAAKGPTFQQVHNSIKELRKVDEETGKRMAATLAEIGTNGDPGRLAELHRDVVRALSRPQN
jgi:serine/threonine protein kinase